MLPGVAGSYRLPGGTGAGGYRAVLVADACATRDDAAHNATLATVYRGFGDVRPTAEVMALLLSR
ncbi:hypothetical protein [Streptomyces radicis]|uniref:Isochorismatase family protein n=1 Tax=Streptomyces radicis TaxID=1750517 RepID=A0A3A9WCA0_9ACTN|nr:hypothetical protein [Streptomyces radicis]RKN06994.1 hypothetical protein D7319_20050 [Streptomyces radicis]RKN15866.1 hypothetical protein D7318_26745 [Streptomyces radicis]